MFGLESGFGGVWAGAAPGYWAGRCLRGAPPRASRGLPAGGQRHSGDFTLGSCADRESSATRPMRRRRGTLRAVLLIFASVCAWYAGYLLAELIPDAPLSSAIYSIRSVGERAVLKAPAPQRQKCDRPATCPPNTYAYRLLSGRGAGSYAKICFEDELLIGEEVGNVGRGINIAIVDYAAGRAVAARQFDVHEGDNSGAMAQFLRGAPAKSLLFMVTQGDGSAHLQEDATEAIGALGSKEIRNLRSRSSWAFLAAKGFELPAQLQREEINHAEDAKDRSSGWPAEVQIEGCVPKEPS